MNVSVLIAGDFCPQDRVAEEFERNDFSSVLGKVKSYIDNAHYSIVNFECPIVHGEEVPILKCGPNLYCSKKGLDAVKWAGFNCVTLANNHILDYGEKGAHNTIEYCKELGMDYVGGGENLKEASQILYKTIHGVTLGIINCCEHEFSIATEENSGAYPLSSVKQFYQIKEARENADFVIVIVHGGSEFYQLPTPRMQEIYRFFIDAGANTVINHHQHCYSGYEIYNDCPIFYGLGNFCFDNKNKRDDNWNKGYFVILHLEKGVKIYFEIIPYEQCNDMPSINLIDNANESENIENLNRIIANEKILKESYSSFVENNKDTYLLALEPYTGHWGGLRQRKLIPSLLSKEYFLRIYGYLKCEAHFDRVMEILRKKIYE